jgi:alpha-L-fucosidase
VVESWSICPEDVEWIAHRSIEDYADYKEAYEALQTTFDPRGFDPDRWAEAARDAGMKYVVFTTKHHDGFAIGAYFSKPDWHSQDYWRPYFATPESNPN